MMLTIYRQFCDDLAYLDTSEVGRLSTKLHMDDGFAREAGPEFVAAADHEAERRHIIVVA